MTVETGMKKALIVLVAIAVLLTLALQRDSIVALFHGGGSGEPISATGTVEIETVDVSAELSGIISFLGFEESEQVRQGDILARIDKPDLRSQFDRDKASVARAEALLKDLKRGARNEEIAQARAARDAALANRIQAERDAKRYAALYDEQVISKKEFERIVLVADLAASNLKQAQEALLVMQAGPRPDQVAAQEEEVKRLYAVLAMTRSLLDKTEIRSPADGTVLTKNFELGELAPQGGVLYSIGHYADCHIRIYIPSTILGLVNQGQTAEIRVDSFPDTVFRGYVTEIAQEAEFAPRQSITPDERANLVFRVKVAVDNPDGLLKPGMPADVTLR